LIEQTAREIQHWQQRIAAARKSHTKQKRKKLRKLAIKLKLFFYTWRPVFDVSRWLMVQISVGGRNPGATPHRDRP
jgi:hypothetical protein